MTCHQLPIVFYCFAGAAKPVFFVVSCLLNAGIVYTIEYNIWFHHLGLQFVYLEYIATLDQINSWYQVKSSMVFTNGLVT